MKVRWLFCSCQYQGCWCFLLVKVPFNPRLVAERLGDMGPCTQCAMGDHMAGDPPWYYKMLIESQKDFMEHEGAWHE